MGSSISSIADADGSTLEGNKENYAFSRAHPRHWMALLSSLNQIAPRCWLSNTIICSYLMDLWWSQHHQHQSTVMYLPLDSLHQMSCALALLDDSHSATVPQPTNGPFYALYGSLIPLLSHRRVCFVLIRNINELLTGIILQSPARPPPNHFFAVVFDYTNHRAYSFGAFPRSRPATTCMAASKSNWNRWGGPGLWRNIAKSLGWEDVLSAIDTISVVTKDWVQVWCACSLLIKPLIWSGPEWV